MYHDAHADKRVRASYDCRDPRAPSTPWGRAQDVITYAPGIVFYSTPGHGGYKLSAERRRAMIPEFRDAKPYAGGNWYEEDCDWALVAASFPEVFGAIYWDGKSAVEHAWGFIERWHPELYAAYTARKDREFAPVPV